MDKTGTRFWVTCIDWSAFIIVVSMEWTTTVWTFFFSDKAGPSIFSAATFSNSMKILLSTITFDNPEECKKDCHMIPCEMLTCNTSKYLLPSLYLSIHETLYPIGNQIAFRQHISSKPHKYELLFNSLNDASFSHTEKVSTYAGKAKKWKSHTTSIQQKVMFVI